MPSTVLNHKAYIITGPTSGIGRATAFELAKHGSVVLVGRDRRKLDELQKRMEQMGQHAVAVFCDLSDIASVREAAKEILGLNLPLAGLLNNAGILEMHGPTKNALGWDMTFATNHLGPFALTEALAPHFSDKTNVVFVVSAVEDPERKAAVAVGFRGGRFISVEASARGHWKPGGSEKPGFDAYATSKQAILAAMMAFARETPRLCFSAVEPGLNVTTGLGSPNGLLRLFQKFVFPVLVPLLKPFVGILSTPKQAARVIARIMTETSGETGIYYDERGSTMRGSAQVRDPDFQDRIVSETRAFLVDGPA